MHETTDAGGRPALRIESAEHDLLIATTGAQILRWTYRGDDLLWTATNAEYAAGKPVRAGVPIVFPWFGDHPSDPELPAHGFARNLEWQSLDVGSEGAALRLASNAATHAMWPHAFELQLNVSLAPWPRIALTVTNAGDEPFAFEAALHTYFAVGDIHTTAVRGLENVPFVEHAAEPEDAWDPAQPIRFRAETDLVFQQVPPRIEIDTPALDRVITLDSEGSASAIV